ncbi:MAG: DUF3093 domain-containing protein [Micrococcaceae bacterium]
METKMEAQDNSVLYQEKLTPSPGVWLIAAFSAILFYFVFTPVNQTAGIFAPFIAFALFALILLTMTPRIVLTPKTLTAGKATIERQYLGQAVAYEGDDKKLQLGSQMDGRSYTCIRGWIDPIVKIENLDSTDTVPFWIFSSRTPQAFLNAYNK